MLLRWLVNTYLKQAVQQKLMESVAEATRKQGRRGAGAAEPAAEDSQSQPPPCEIVFVFALGIESGGLVDLLEEPATTRCATFVEHAGNLGGRRVAIVEGGVGRKLIAQATVDAIAIHRPAWVVSTGFAGALVDELARGHFLLADSVTDADGAAIAVDVPLVPTEAALGFHVGRLLTVDRLIRKQSQRRELAAAHQALACDMETLAVAETCAREQTRFLSVRIISDAVDDRLPKEAERLLTQKSLAGKLGALTGALLNRPSSVKDLWQLREDAIKASDRLAKVLAGLAGQLPISTS